MTETALREEKWLRLALFGLLGLTIFRVLIVGLNTLDLGPDEAQYWRWSEAFDWGYYSKPPLIAWIIGITTSVFGDSEWAIRLSPPFLHTTISVMLLFLGREMFDTRVGIAAAFTWALMPAVWLSSTIMSTDATLLPLWTLSLLFLWRMRESPNWGNALGLGIAVGAGFLAKYAMIYMLLGIALAAIVDRPTRQALLSKYGLLVVAAGVIVMAPHIIWNVSNGFKTVGHTADNANWGTEPWNLARGWASGSKFLIDQLGVFGPLNLLALLSAVIVMSMEQLRSDPRIRWLACFILPPLLIISVQAIISRAHANWAATAYPAAAILLSHLLLNVDMRSRQFWIWMAALAGLVTLIGIDAALWVRPLAAIGTAAIFYCLGMFVRFKPQRSLAMSLGFHFVIGLIGMMLIVLPASTANSLGMANAFKRLRGWEETTTRLNALAEAIGAQSIIVDEREIWHGLDYYGRDGGLSVPVRAWRRHGIPKNYSEETPIKPPEDVNALLASYRPGFRERIKADFTSVEELETIEIDLGGGKVRRFVLYRVSGYEPLERTGDYEARFSD